MIPPSLRPRFSPSLPVASSFTLSFLSMHSFPLPHQVPSSAAAACEGRVVKGGGFCSGLSGKVLTGHWKRGLCSSLDKEKGCESPCPKPLSRSCWCRSSQVLPWPPASSMEYQVSTGLWRDSGWDKGGGIRKNLGTKPVVVEAAERAVLAPEEEDGAERKKPRHHGASRGGAWHREAAGTGMC